MTENFKRRLFIFDLDGVLVDSKKIHFNALNAALNKIDQKYLISEEDQSTTFEGLPTKEKLKLLSSLRGLPEEFYKTIWEEKQKQSIAYFKSLEKDKELIELFKIIKEYHVDIAVASNCIKETVETCLTSLGLIDLVDLYLSNEDVSQPKPNPEIYTKCIEHFVCHPDYTTIFEDSHVGKTAAIASGARLISIENRSFINKETIFKALNEERKKINVLIPMAGEGSRFIKAGYKDPKPMIDVYGKSMIELVHDNINLDAHYIFIAKDEHVIKYNLEEHIRSFCNDYTIIRQDGRLDGAAKTALLAKDIINNQDHLLIANSDQYIDWDSSETIDKFIRSGVDGAILTFKAKEEKWSYIKENDGLVEEVFEKIVASDNATCGIYFWKHGSDFIQYAEKMIEKNIRTNNEFYICPVYNQAILDKKIISFSEVRQMHGLGTPEDLEIYLKYLDKRIDIRNRDYTEKIFEISEDEFCVKYINPEYEIYDREISKNKEYNYYDYNSEMVKLPESASLEKYKERVHRWVLNPIVTKIHNSNDAFDLDKSVYLTPYHTRFFHVYLEILPKLFLLKEKDPNFKLIMFHDEELNEDKIFPSLLGIYNKKNGRESDGRALKFWLDKLDINYECVNLSMLKDYNLKFKNSYVFYEAIRNQNLKDIAKEYDKKFFNGPTIYKDLKEYHPHAILQRGDSSVDVGANAYLKKAINNFIETNELDVVNENKKIYISRKNYVRSHKNEKEIEDYFISIGYESVCLEDFDPIEQIQIFRKSSDIVCYLGSSIVNAYFLNHEVNLTILALDSDSDAEFNKNMLGYYSMQIQDQKINKKFINIPQIFNDDVDYFLNKELEISNGI